MTTGLDRALLDRLKKLESEEDSFSLVGDLPAMRLLIVWRRVTVYRRDPADYEGLLGRALPPWRRLWLPFELDFDELAAAADIPTRRHAQTEAERAMSLLWVYPDNSANAFALELAIRTYKSRLEKTTQAGNVADLRKRLSLVEARLGGGK